VTELIRRVARGRTVLMVEHNMSVISSICDRVTVMQRGQVLAEGSYDEVSRNPEVIAAYMGEAEEELAL
jgi:branched-chain amino acid transport system ATP-binding protein